MLNNISEKQIIEIFRKQFQLRSMINDVEIFPSNKKVNVVKVDTLVSSTDLTPNFPLIDVARKSIVACVSDFAAKGVRPYFGIISITIPKEFTVNMIKKLTIGFANASKEFKIKFLGGDTNQGKELTITICLFGHAENITSRKGSCIGDIVFVTGPFGYSSSGLQIALGRRATKQFMKQALSAFYRPDPKLSFGISAAKYFTSSMDSSDGLATTLHELARQSKHKIHLTSLPCDDSIVSFAKNDKNLHQLVLFGGEEYEIVATCSRKNYSKIEKLAKLHKVTLMNIGTVTRGSGVMLNNDSSIPDKGWSHFINTS